MAWFGRRGRWREFDVGRVKKTGMLEDETQGHLDLSWTADGFFGDAQGCRGSYRSCCWAVADSMRSRLAAASFLLWGSCRSSRFARRCRRGYRSLVLVKISPSTAISQNSGTSTSTRTTPLLASNPPATTGGSLGIAASIRQMNVPASHLLTFPFLHRRLSPPTQTAPSRADDSNSVLTAGATAAYPRSRTTLLCP